MTPAPEVRSLLATLRSQGKGLREIAREMNRLSIRSPLGAHWHARTVGKQLEAMAA